MSANLRWAKEPVQQLDLFSRWSCHSANSGMNKTESIAERLLEKRFLIFRATTVSVVSLYGKSIKAKKKDRNEKHNGGRLQCRLGLVFQLPKVKDNVTYSELGCVMARSAQHCYVHLFRQGFKKELLGLGP